MMDRVFTLRFWREGDGKGPAADEWRVRIRYLNRRHDYYVDGAENAFSLVRSLLAEPNGGSVKEFVP